MTLVELKRRLVPGTKLTLVGSRMGPCRKLRIVESVTTVDVGMSGDDVSKDRVSYLPWPKASQLQETDKGFQVVIEGETAARYEWGHNA